MRTAGTIDRCPGCGGSTARWLDYFCPACGAHHDGLYCAETRSGALKDRMAIAGEYRAAGMVAEAARLAAPCCADRVDDGATT